MTSAGVPSGSSKVSDALAKNETAAEAVKKAAEDLAVVHAVLDTKVSQGAQDGDVKRAVKETEKIEKRLTDTGEKLDEVNEILRDQR